MTLAAKVASHSVTADAALGAFVVKSGASGALYVVRPAVEGALSTAVCSCEWARQRRNGRECSHVLAVRNFAARALGRQE